MKKKQKIFETLYYTMEFILKSLTYTNHEGIDTPIRVEEGTKEKIIYNYLFGTNRQINENAFQNVLPVITLKIQDFQFQSELATPKAGRFVYNEGKQFRPVPVRTTFNCSVNSHTKDVLFEVAEQLFQIFDPSHTVAVKFSTEQESKSLQIVMSSLSVNIENEFDQTADRILTMEMNFTIDTYVYKDATPVDKVKQFLVNINEYTEFTITVGATE